MASSRCSYIIGVWGTSERAVERKRRKTTARKSAPTHTTDCFWLGGSLAHAHKKPMSAIYDLRQANAADAAGKDTKQMNSVLLGLRLRPVLPREGAQLPHGRLHSVRACCAAAANDAGQLLGHPAVPKRMCSRSCRGRASARRNSTAASCAVRDRRCRTSSSARKGGKLNQS